MREPPVSELRFVAGTVVAGHGVASGQGPDRRFPKGTIALQLPLFKARGVDVARILGAEPRRGTINLDIAPFVPVIVRPEFRLADVAWSDLMPPESFMLFRVHLQLGETECPALLYRPDPETKPDHHQPSTVVEIIAASLPIAYGDRLRVGADAAFLRFEPRAGD